MGDFGIFLESSVFEEIFCFVGLIRGLRRVMFFLAVLKLNFGGRFLFFGRTVAELVAKGRVGVRRDDGGYSGIGFCIF